MRRALVTVLKADISGSTPLAEKLDPEELRGILGSYFSALARAIRGHGGRVDKYIGDAVMAVFGLPDAHPDDAARATRAALAMQEAIAAENDRLEARYGVRLSLRIGVHTGELSAADGVELTLMGDVVTIAESMEAAAPLNTVLVSATTRQATARRFRFSPAAPVKIKGRAETLPAFRPLAARKRAADAARTGDGAAGSASLQLRGQKQHVLQEERKVVTVLFADIVVSEGRLVSERQRAVLSGYFADVAREVERFGGTIDKYIGDAVMAVFGAPVSHDDDGARAIGAGLAIHAAIHRRNDELHREHDVRLSARVGINTGEVVAGLLVGEVRAYTVTGDTVNTAQRIESVAPLGEVLVSESTRDLARHAFVYEAVAPLTLKGKAQPVAAFRVVGRERRASPREGTPLVGRDIEFAGLRALVEQAVAGTGRLAHVHGEAGVGKTRLIGELLTSLPRAAGRLRARCASYEQETPYALVADVLRGLIGLQLADDEATARTALTTALALFGVADPTTALPILLEVLGYPAESSLTPQAKRGLIVAQLRALLERRASAAGLAVVLEDIHWLDAASAEALRDIAAIVPTFACLLVTTSRGADVPWTAEEFDLQPLGIEIARTMLERLAPALDAKTRGLIVERTGGNPFFIEEVAHSIASGRTATVPTSVQDLLEARLDALDAQPRLVAQRAAVIGRSFWTRVLERVTAGNELEPALATLDEERFVQAREVVPERTYAFRHALVQEVVYKTQLVSQRKRAHVAVGDAYSALYEGRLDEFVDVLAYHYGRGDDDPKALGSLARAGDRAKSLFANDEALAYYGAALERAPAGEGPLEAGSILERIGDVQLVVGHYDDAVQSFEAARSRMPRPSAPTDARLYRKEAQARRSQGAYDKALDAFARAREALGPTDDAELAWIEFGIGRLYHLRGEYAHAREFVERGVAIAERFGDDLGIADGLQQLGNIVVRIGDAREAVGFYRRSRDLFARSENLQAIAAVRINLGIALTRLGRYDDAQREMEAALALWQRVGDSLRIGLVWNNLGDIHREAGRPVEAIDAYEKAIRVQSEIGYASGVALALIGLGDASVGAGRAAEGKAQLEDAIRRYAALGTAPYHAELYRFLASAELALGDLAAADAAAARSIEFARAAGARHHEASAQRVQAEIAAARGDRQAALRLLDTSRATLTELGEGGELARTEAVLRALG